MANILCFGDSITFGYSDPEGGWTQRLSRSLGKIYVSSAGNYLHAVYNLAIDGDDSARLASRIAEEIKPRSYDDVVIILFIGVNDSIYFPSKGNKVDVDDFKDNMRKILKVALGATSEVIVVGVTPVDEKKTQPVEAAMEPGASYSNSRIRLFNDALCEMAEKEKVEFVDFFEDMRKLDFDTYFFTDGSHPNSIGHQYIADKLTKKVAEMANNYDSSAEESDSAES